MIKANVCDYKVKDTALWKYVIIHIYDDRITGTFYEKAIAKNKASSL